MTCGSVQLRRAPRRATPYCRRYRWPVTLLLLIALMLCATLFRCHAADSTIHSRSSPDAGADMIGEEDLSAAAAASVSRPPTAAAAAAAAPAAAPLTSSLPQLAAARASNDPTTHMSYSSDGTEETHCTRTGECMECNEVEKMSAACLPTGSHQLVTCEVASLQPNITDAASSQSGGDSPSSSGPTVLRTFTQYASCESVEGSASFWAFQALCLMAIAGSLWVMRRRRRVVMSRHQKRMDRLVNA